MAIFDHQCFIRTSEVQSTLHHGAEGPVQSKEYYFVFTHTFLAFLVVVQKNKNVFIILISFLVNIKVKRLINKRLE